MTEYEDGFVRGFVMGIYVTGAICTFLITFIFKINPFMRKSVGLIDQAVVSLYPCAITWPLWGPFFLLGKFFPIAKAFWFKNVSPFILYLRQYRKST